MNDAEALAKAVSTINKIVGDIEAGVEITDDYLDDEANLSSESTAVIGMAVLLDVLTFAAPETKVLVLQRAGTLIERGLVNIT